MTRRERGIECWDENGRTNSVSPDECGGDGLGHFRIGRGRIMNPMGGTFINQKDNSLQATRKSSDAPLDLSPSTIASDVIGILRQHGRDE